MSAGRDSVRIGVNGKSMNCRRQKCCFVELCAAAMFFLAEGGEEHNAAPIGLWNVLAGA